MTLDLSQKTVAIIGLGYVGLPLAVEFGKVRTTIGFDIRKSRIDELQRGHDATREVGREELASAAQLSFSSDAGDLETCGVFIVAVPTPVDSANRPDLRLLSAASETVGRAMKPGAVVVFESTVFPGCTRGVCVPVLEKTSGLVCDRDFYVGYSPERINPGDKTRRLPDIVKITSGSTEAAARAIDAMYGQIVTAGTFCAATIEVAEAAKVIENTQRDLNIALMNELAIIFHKLGLDTAEVLAAAGTKWNFLPFRPGLVGGHCIGVDPYYLTYRAEEIGYHPDVILAGRRINDGMGQVVADRVMRMMMKRGSPVVGSRILVLGLAFKENCPDLRNSKVIDVINELKDFNAQIDVFDPWVDAVEAEEEYGLRLLSHLPLEDSYAAVIVAVGHDEFKRLGHEKLRKLGSDTSIFFDVKGIFDKNDSDGRL